MKIDIRGKQFKITDGLRDHVIQKMRKLGKYPLRLESAHIVFDVQKITQTCEILITGKNINLTAIEETEDLYASLDAAIESLNRQLAKYHERIKDHREKELPMEEEQESSEEL